MRVEAPVLGAGQPLLEGEARPLEADAAAAACATSFSIASMASPVLLPGRGSPWISMEGRPL